MSESGKPGEKVEEKVGRRRNKENRKKGLEEMCEEILSSLDRIARVISCAEFSGDRLYIYDPPYVLEVGREMIVLREVSGDEGLGGEGAGETEEVAAILTPQRLEYLRSEEDLKVLEDWCVALTSLSFRRFFVKGLKGFKGVRCKGFSKQKERGKEQGRG